MGMQAVGPTRPRRSHWATCDCVLPIRLARAVCPPARDTALKRASMTVGFITLQLFMSRTCVINNYASIAVMTNIGERVKGEREAKGWSQAELARRVTRAGYSITQGGIAQIERRGDTEPKSIVQLAQALGVSVTWLQSSRGDKTRGVTGDDDGQQTLLATGRRGRTAEVPAGPVRAPLGRARPLQVFSSAQGGTEGAMILSNDPVAWIPRDARLEGIAEAYGC